MDFVSGSAAVEEESRDPAEARFGLGSSCEAGTRERNRRRWPLIVSRVVLVRLGHGKGIAGGDRFVASRGWVPEAGFSVPTVVGAAPQRKGRTQREGFEEEHKISERAVKLNIFSF